MNQIDKPGMSIYAALAAAQQQMGKALKDSDNPHFKSKYADLSSVMDACIPALNANGFAVIQPTVDDESGRYVETVLLHESGESLKCRVPLIVQKNDMQGYGSAVTYARRYGLMCMAGIAPEDDDGNAAAKAAPPSDQPKKAATWVSTIVDELPENSTPREKAIAITDALCSQFKRMNGLRQISNEWDRRADLIAKLELEYEDLHLRVIDAYELRVMEIKESTQ
jgi:hypothetical protein